MAAFEATGEQVYLDGAERIAESRHRPPRRGLGYRVAEHFTEDWRVDRDYRATEMFRPAGTTPGPCAGMGAAALQLYILGDRRNDWMRDARRALFEQSIDLGWDEDAGGFFYTLDWDDRPSRREKFWWPHRRGHRRGHLPVRARPEPVSRGLVPPALGASRRAASSTARTAAGSAELSEDLTPADTLFAGQARLYHALQACLIPLYPAKAA